MGVLLFKGGVGVGMLKWQTSGFPSRSGGNLKEGGQIVNFGRAIGISVYSVWFKSSITRSPNSNNRLLTATAETGTII